MQSYRIVAEFWYLLLSSTPEAIRNPRTYGVASREGLPPEVVGFGHGKSPYPVVGKGGT